MTTAFRRGRTVVVNALRARTPFIAITGKEGSGRATLLNAALADLGDSAHVVRASAAGDRPLELGALLAKLLGKPEGSLRSDDLEEAFAALTEARAGSALRVLVITHAEHAARDLLGHLLLLSTLLGTRSALLQVILIGPPDFERTLHPEIARRIGTAGAHVAIAPMSEEDSRAYVANWLRMHATDLPSPRVVEKIVRAGEGNPGTLDALLAREVGVDLDPREPPVGRPPAGQSGVDTRKRAPGDAPTRAVPVPGTARVGAVPNAWLAAWPTPPRSSRRGVWLAAAAVLGVVAVVAVGGVVADLAGWDEFLVAQPSPAFDAGPAARTGANSSAETGAVPSVQPMGQAAPERAPPVSTPTEPAQPLASSPSTPSPGSGPPSVSETIPAPPDAASAPVPEPEPTLSPETVAALVKRGDAMVAMGDIAAARLLYERAASSSPEAALMAGRMYDPDYLARIGARGIKADPEQAARWYGRASEAGNTEARALLMRLGASGAR